MKRMDFELKYKKLRFLIEQRGPIHIIEAGIELDMGNNSLYRLIDFVKIYHNIDMIYDSNDKKFKLTDIIPVENSERIS